MGVVEARNGEVEFVAQLRERYSENGESSTSSKSPTHPNNPVQINSFVTMIVDLDFSSQHVHQSLPLQIIREFRVISE